MKSLGSENIFSSPCAVKAQKLTSMGLFKIESVLSKSLKIPKIVKFPKFALKFDFFYFYLTLTQLRSLNNPTPVNF